MSCDPTCKRRLPCEDDQEKVKDLYREYYALHAARLTVKILDKEASREHSFYNDTRTKDRVYLPDQTVSMFAPYSSSSAFNQVFWGIDETRTRIFTVCVPLLEDLGIVFKPGDLILFDGQDHEVLTSRRKEDAYFDQWNYAFEREIATHIPNRGS